ncbi:MAG TPA: TAXI family TRAP transporter solute-binding subunit [Stellaceae bacterium]|nr:TAXI family TRAP transporter solute-binding subunit [Stellaceae bacterium]
MNLLISPRLPAATAVLSAVVLAALVALPARAADTRPESPNNKGVVELETGSSTGISVRIAEDLANIVDDGSTRRVLPVVGKGALQTITDLKLLHGVDIAIVPTDVLDYARQQKLYPGIENSLTYITKLYNEEFHLLARQDIKSIADLANQTVNVDLRNSGTAVTAGKLFSLLKISVTPANDDQAVALEKLRKGQIAALAFVSGKPAPIFRGLAEINGLHFISVPLRPEITAAYVPTRLTGSDYPGLVSQDQPVDTIAVGTALVVAPLTPYSDRYRNVANFVDTFFTQFQGLLDPGHHAKWSEVNLAADFPGWRRFPPADEWLKRNTSPAVALKPQDLRAIFSRFIDERQQATGGQPMTQQQKDDLFGQFERWQSGQLH